MSHRPLAMELTAFDAKGIFVGRCHYSIDDGWHCFIDGMQVRGLQIDEARQWLREHGAKTIKESDGRKY